MKILLDIFDYQIVALLQEQAKITNLQLSETIGLSTAATLERVRRLEAQGILTSYHARLNSQAIGLNTNLWLQVCLHAITPETIQQFEEQVRNIQEIVACYHGMGAADFLLHIFASDLAAYRTLLIHQIGSIPNIKSITTFSVLQTIKETGLPLHHLPASIAM
jgi:Lrp/AsnC family leucine-responsive transcriptional regulator